MSGSADRPLWVLVQEMVLPGSIGAELITKIPGLGERLRPETTFGQPFGRLSLVREIGDVDLSTYGDVLGLPTGRFDSFFSRRWELAVKLSSYLRNLLILPHSRLLQAIYDRPQFPAPADREQEIINGVERVLGQLPGQTVSALVLRFGLNDGIPRTLKETGRHLQPPVTKERVRQCIQRASLRYLRRPDIARLMREYFVLPEASFGREIFGAVLVVDLPNLDGEENIRVLGLHSGIFAMLHGLDIYRIEDLVMADLSKDRNAGIFLIEDEIASALQRRKTEIPGRAARAVEQEALAAAQRRVRIGEPRNTLMPEIELSQEQLEELDKMPLKAAGLSTRAHNALIRGDIRTVGELLRLTEEELLAIRNIGVKTETEIVDKLTIFLKSQ